MDKRNELVDSHISNVKKNFSILPPPEDSPFLFKIIESDISYPLPEVSEKDRSIFKRYAEVIVGEHNSFNQLEIQLRDMEIFRIDHSTSLSDFQLMRNV
jgi:hypothetical protein